METIISLTKYEKASAPLLREQLTRAESVEDVRKFFYQCIRDFLCAISNSALQPTYADVVLTPGQAPYFMLSKGLRNSEAFKQFDDSDLLRIIERFAEQSSHRFLHLTKHREKTEAKIRPI